MNLSHLVRMIPLLLAPLLMTACVTQQPSIRTNVRQLLSLQKTRLDVAAPVARSKWNSGAAIDDPAREQAILDKVAVQARQMGLDEQWARRFFQDQFDAGKIVQRDLHRQWQLAHQPPFTDAPDLGQDVRPVLDRLTPELLALLATVQDKRCNTEMSKALAELAPQILNGDYSVPVQQKALSALYCPA